MSGAAQRNAGPAGLWAAVNATLSPVTLALALVLAAHLAIHIIVAMTIGPRLFGPLLEYLNIDVYREDSWMPMRAAWVYLHSEQEAGKSVYDAIFFEQRIKFQYPLTSLLVYEPFGWPLFGDLANTRPLLLHKLLHFSCWVALTLSPLVLWRILRASIAAYAPGMRRAGRVDSAVQLVLIFVLTITFYPLLRAYALGQVQAWLNLLFFVGIWLWIAGRQVESGLLFAVSTLFKPHGAVLFLWGALRGKIGFVAAGLVGVGVGGLIALIAYGWHNNIDYLEALSYMGARGEGSVANQSVNGILNRLVDPSAVFFSPNSFPDLHPLVRYGTLAAAVVFLAAGVFGRLRKADKGGPIDLALAGLLFTIASPIAWEHHYGVAMAGFVLAAPAVLASRSPLLKAALLASYLLCASDPPLSSFFGAAPWNIVRSYLVFGALILAAILYWLPPWPQRPATAWRWGVPETLTRAMALLSRGRAARAGPPT